MCQAVKLLITYKYFQKKDAHLSISFVELKQLVQSHLNQKERAYVRLKFLNG